MLLLLVPIVSAASAPTSEAEVNALLRGLIAEKPAARIDAANALMKTPPPLVHLLDRTTIDPACAEKVSVGDVADLSPTCQRWNQAMYHFVRVVGALARDSVNPATPLGAWCLPRTQPSADDRLMEPACPLVGRLRWMVNDGFDDADFLVFGDAPPFAIPEVASTEALTTAAHTAYVTALQPPIPNPATLAKYPQWSATEGTRSFHVVPVCGGLASMRELCSFHLVVHDGDRFERTVFLPTTTTNGKNEVGIPYPGIRMPAAVHVLLEGPHAMVVTDGGCCGDQTRRTTVYDVTAAPRFVCEVSESLADPDAGPPVKMPRFTPLGCVSRTAVANTPAP